MKYNVIYLISDNLSDSDIKKIINKRIIDLSDYEL